MRSHSPLSAVKRCAASLATAGMLVLGMAGAASAAEAVETAPTSANPTTVPPQTAETMEKTASTCDSLVNMVNRPTVTGVTCVVKKNHVLVEGGYSRAKITDPAGDITAEVYPSISLRAGTSIKNLEVSVTAPNYARSKQNGVKNGQVIDSGVVASGSPQGGMGIGASYQLGTGKRYSHVVSLGTSLPIGDDGSAVASPYLSYQGTYSINRMFSVTGGLAQTSYATKNVNGAVQRNGQFTPSLVLNAYLPDSTTLFVEGASTKYNKDSSATSLIAGAAKGLGKRAQIDVEYIRQNYKAVGQDTTKINGFGAGLAYYI